MKKYEMIELQIGNSSAEAVRDATKEINRYVALGYELVSVHWPAYNICYALFTKSN